MLNRQIHTIKHKALLIFVNILFLLCIPDYATAFEVVVVKSSDIKPYKDALNGFTESCNCEVRELNSSDDRKTTIKNIFRISPDAVLAIGTDAFRKVKSIDNIPVIYTMVIPSETASLLQKNISGVSMDVSPETYVTTMGKLFPEAKRIGLLYDPRHTGLFVKKAIEAAHDRGFEIISKTVRNSSDVPALIDGMRDRIDIFWMLPDLTVVNSETLNYMLLFSFQNKVPIFTFSRKYIEMGALAALNIDPFNIGVQTGKIAKMLLRGRKGPVISYANNAFLIINKKIAKKFGIKIKDESFSGAEIIE
jgi:putative ABC transport system substrate-binding protein